MKFGFIRPLFSREPIKAINVYFEDFEKNLETTSGRESRNWRNIGPSVNFEKILKNKII